MSRRQWVAAAAVGLLGMGVASIALVRTAFFFPKERMEMPVQCAADAPLMPADGEITALIWNVQFSAGRGQEFFYDGGEAVSVTPETVEKTLDAIAAVIEEVDPDIVILQEIDRDSRRTGGIDQHEALLSRNDYPCHTSAAYHRAPYVPHPPQEHLGKVDMHLSVFSRYQLGTATRHRLPELQESTARKVFNLRRAVLEVEVPLADGGRFLLFNTHLSAFSRGDGTLGKQIDRLDTLATEAESSGIPWILTGDMNSLPPGDDPSRLAEEDQILYSDADTPIQVLFDHHGTPDPLKFWNTDPESQMTYLPYGADRPDRTLDYTFHGSRVRPTLYRVMQQHGAISDHLPLLLKFKIGE